MTITRRQALAGLAAGSVAGAAPQHASAQTPAAEAAPAPLIASGMCVLTPEQDEGPFYLDPKLNREDITEGRKGVALKLLLQVVTAATCAPVPNARVDVWHADATGNYSGFEGAEGKGFLRGTQFSNASGLVRFTTIWPGWYPGRTPHIHLKVFLGNRTVLTGQMYFPDALSEFIFRNAAPYNRRKRQRDTVNTSDGVLHFGGGGHESFCSVKEEVDHYLASLVIGVREEGGSASPGAMPPPPPGNGGPDGPLPPDGGAPGGPQPPVMREGPPPRRTRGGLIPGTGS